MPLYNVSLVRDNGSNFNVQVDAPDVTQAKGAALIKARMQHVGVLGQCALILRRFDSASDELFVKLYGDFQK